jgi:hypothetical protein
MGSTRLPGKSLKDLGGTTLVESVYAGASTAKSVSEVIIAIPESRVDEELFDFLTRKGLNVVLEPMPILLFASLEIIHFRMDLKSIVLLIIIFTLIRVGFQQTYLKFLIQGTQMALEPRFFLVRFLRTSLIQNPQAANRSIFI